jgi:predicted permease
VIARYLHRNMDRATGFLRLQSALMLAVYLLSVIGCVALLAIRSQSYFEQPERRLVAVLLVGMIANALVFGAISGVFDRYQGRLAWLPVLGLAMLLSRREVIARSAATVAA